MSSKSRKFALVSYIEDTEVICDIIQKHTNSIRSYAFIKHDKDPTDVHHHLVIRTHSNWTCVAIAKWFNKAVPQVNTFAQFVIDDSGIIDYLTHKNEKDKEHYDEGEITDGGLTDLLPVEDSKDDSFEIIESILSCTPTRELCRLYGREFMYHYNTFRAVAAQILAEECGESKSIIDTIQQEQTKTTEITSPNYTKL